MKRRLIASDVSTAAPMVEQACRGGVALIHFVFDENIEPQRPAAIAASHKAKPYRLDVVKRSQMTRITRKEDIRF